MILFTLVLFEALVDAQTDDYTQNFAGVTTAAGVYAANVTLSEDLYEDNVISVSAVASNVSSDSPAANSYNSVSNRLEVGGLDQSKTRTLSVTYDIEDPTLPTGMVVFLQIFIWFILLVDLGLLVGAAYAFFTS